MNSPPGGKFIEEDFPSLSDGASKRGKSGEVSQPQCPGKGNRSGRDGHEEVKGHSTNLQPGETAARRQQAHPMGGMASKGQRKTMADILKAGDKDSIFFEPEKIKRIGTVGESSAGHIFLRCRHQFSC